MPHIGKLLPVDKLLAFGRPQPLPGCRIDRETGAPDMSSHLYSTLNTVGKLNPGTGPVRELEPGWSGDALDARVAIRLSLACMAMAELSLRGSQSAARSNNGLHLPYDDPDNNPSPPPGTMCGPS